MARSRPGPSRKRFSALDRYLSGFLAPEEVPDFVLLANDTIDPTLLPSQGATIEATPLSVSVQDIIAVEGPRTPHFSESQKDYRVGFVLIKRPGELIDDSVFVALDRLRREASTRFAILTGGRGLLHIEPPEAGPETPGNPDVVSGGGPRPGSSFDAGLLWLGEQVQPGGYWEDSPGTRFRDTTVALATMLGLDLGFDGALSWSWLNAQPESNTDYLARIAMLRSEVGENPTQERTRLLARQNEEGSWGVAPGFAGDPLDTGFALEAVAPGAPAAVVNEASAFLLQNQNDDGGWSHVVGGASRTSATVQVLEALAVAGIEPPADAITFLLARQNPDGWLRGTVRAPRMTLL